MILLEVIVYRMPPQFSSLIFILGSLKIRVSMNRRIMYMKQICSERHTIDDDDMRYEA
jgi:hypothetical protein